jgi:putative nucleotidyltransferase with HDIG domain
MRDDQLTHKQRIIRIQNFIDRMPSLSTTVTKVLEICNKPETSPKDLNQVISLDPVLTGRVLKLINSAYYSLPNKITTLTRAIIMLGLNTVKNLALSTAVLGTLNKAGTSQGMSMDNFWTHSICVGVTARALATAKKIPNLMREECFVAGLLHDLGKIVLSNCFPEQYDFALKETCEEQGSLLAVEKEIFGGDHGAVGRMIAEKWQFNETISDALSHHHDPVAAPDSSRELVSIVAMANIYANIYDFGSAGDPYQNYDTVVEVLHQVGFQWNELSFLMDVVENEIEKAQIFLQVSREGA